VAAASSRGGVMSEVTWQEKLLGVLAMAARQSSDPDCRDAADDIEISFDQQSGAPYVRDPHLAALEADLGALLPAAKFGLGWWRNGERKLTRAEAAAARAAVARREEREP